jgi:hypothetical protein
VATFPSQTISVTKQELQDIVTEAIVEASKQNIISAQLSDEEHRWVQMAIQAEASKLAFRKAVIEKTITGLIWLGITGFGAAVWTVTYEWLVNHGVYKP